MLKRVLLVLSIVVVILAAFIAGTWTGKRMGPSASREDASTEPPVPARHALVTSNLVNFDETLVNPGHEIHGSGGGLALHAGKILIIKAPDGAIWQYDPAADSVAQLAIHLPGMNLDRFPRNQKNLRYNGVVVFTRGDTEEMLASYGYFDVDRQCVTRRLAIADLPAGWDQPHATPADLSWRVVFDARPCLDIKRPDEHLAGFQEGGQLTMIDSHTVWFTTGDMGRDGIDGHGGPITQSDDSDYGRVMSLSLDDFTTTRIAMGLRNPQGMARDGDGNVWVTDQGPMGGDELDLVHPGANFGWPYDTYGVDYVDRADDRKNWPYLTIPGRHDRYEKPRYFWTPSVAPSSVSYITGLSDRWDGGLLVGSLRGESLFRITLQDTHVLSAERVFLGQRIRDELVTMGRIYFLSAEGLFGYLVPRPGGRPPGQGESADVLHQAGCMECHSGTDQPSLRDILGSPIASQPGVNYSEALKRHGGVWTRDNLRKFIESPGSFARGTNMPTPGVDSGNIDNIIDALGDHAPTPD